MICKKTLVILSLQIFLLSSCSMFKGMFGGGSNNPGETEEAVKESKEEKQRNRADAQNNVKPATNTELELKLAKLWARVDELDEMNRRQKERIKVLEKGLMLGLLPDELVNEEDRKYTQKPGGKSPPADEAKNLPAAPAAPPVEVVAPASVPVVTEPPPSPEGYNKQLAVAQEQYQSGHYGRAIADFSTLAKNYPTETKDGNYRYWIALSWMNLKEFESSHREFDEFIKSHPGNQFVPRAKFNKAKVEYSLGFRERALDLLRQVIKEHPNEDAAEMAKQEISSLEKSL